MISTAHELVIDLDMVKRELHGCVDAMVDATVSARSERMDFYGPKAHLNRLITGLATLQHYAKR